jgi:hypothetical protein
MAGTVRPVKPKGRYKKCYGVEFYEALDFEDSQRIEETRLLLGKELSLFNNAMALLTGIIYTLYGEYSDNSDHEIAKITLIVTVFNHLRAAGKLLLCGYCVESLTLVRKIFEMLLLAEYFHYKPEKAKEWLNGKDIKPSEIRKALPAKEERNYIYGALCKSVHPNIKGTVLFAGNVGTSLHDFLPIGGACTEKSQKTASMILSQCAFYSIGLINEIVYKDLMQSNKVWQNKYHQVSQDAEQMIAPILERLTESFERRWGLR